LPQNRSIQTQDEAQRRATSWLFALGIVVAVLIAYYPVWHAGFIWDDDKYVTENPLLTGRHSLQRIWLSRDAPSQYFPLTYTTFLVERALWGLKPAGYHRINFFLHAANALLAWRLLLRLRAPGAWLAAAIWALHPVQVETVAWVTELKNLLMTFFFFLSLHAWIKFIDADAGRHPRPGSAGVPPASGGVPPTDFSTNKPPLKYYVLSLLYFALALFAKTTACTLPAALLLILWLKKSPIGARRLLQVTPFVVMGLAMGLITMWWERNKLGTQGPTFAIGPLERVLIASRALWFYVGKLLWPANLTFSYPHWTISASDPIAYIWILLVAVTIPVVLLARRRFGRSVEVAALFFAATLSPVLGFIMLGTFRYSFVADHYQYLACLAPIALAAAGLQQIFNRLDAQKPFVQPATCLALLALLGALTWRQGRTYLNEEILWRATIERNPGSWLAENDLGLTLAKEGQTDEAITHFKKSLTINPANTKAINNLANALAIKGQATEAIANYQKSLAINPGDPETLNNLGNILALTGNASGAIQQFRKALEITPNNVQTLNSLAWWLATAPDASQRDISESIALARTANQLTGNSNPLILHTLATAYAEAGRYAEACDTARLAQQLALQRKDDALAARLDQEIRLYQSHAPAP
jgi:tetratricopeptide (TPR) repeat protein